MDIGMKKANKLFLILALAIVINAIIPVFFSGVVYASDWFGVSSANIDSFCGEDVSTTLAEALDGTDVWTHTANETHWFILDLGQTYTITKVRGRSLTFDDPTDVDIYVSDSKVDWGTAVATGISTWQDTDTWQEVATTQKDGRYVKVMINDTEDAVHTISWGKSAPPKITIFDIYYGDAPPTVTTNNATGVEETTVTLNGNITSTGGVNATIRGFEWDTDSGSPYASNWSEEGDFGAGSFSHGLSSLTEGELYYFRAYATNIEGTDYGDEETFLTKPDAPSGFTATAINGTEIDLTWTKGDGAQNTYIRRKEGSYPTDRTDGTLVYNDTGTSYEDTGLTGGRTYYYRAWSYATEGGEEQYSDGYDGDYAETPLTLTLYIIWQNNTTVFLDQSGYGNDAVPTFRNTTTDSDITAYLSSFIPFDYATLTDYGVDTAANLIADTPDEPAEMYEELNTNHLPGAALINNALENADIPQALFWIPFAFAFSAILGMIAFGFTGSLLVQAVVSAFVQFFFALTGGGIIPLWTPMVFVIEAFAIIIARKQLTW